MNDMQFFHTFFPRSYFIQFILISVLNTQLPLIPSIFPIPCCSLFHNSLQLSHLSNIYVSLLKCVGFIGQMVILFLQKFEKPNPSVPIPMIKLCLLFYGKDSQICRNQSLNNPILLSSAQHFIKWKTSKSTTWGEREGGME